jgi:hypothetical protein
MPLTFRLSDLHQTTVLTLQPLVDPVFQCGFDERRTSAADVRESFHAFDHGRTSI